MEGPRGPPPADGAGHGFDATIAAANPEGGPRMDSIYRVTEVIGTSPDSWEAAAKNAVETAAKTLRDLRVGEVEKLDVTIENRKVTSYRARVGGSLKYEGS